VGEARAKKGLGRLLRIFPQLVAQVPAQLMLAGGVRQDDAPLLDFFRCQHSDVSLCLVPPQSHAAMPATYALCDVVILPSLRDGLPNTLLEAMACGRPVLVSAVGGMLDVVTHGYDGLLLPPRDDQAWLEALCCVLQDVQTRERLGTAARQTALERFTPQRELEALLAVYQQALSRSASRTPPATAGRPAPR
jgi:glycosyltransferase involved in cell wall biosynthesis